MRTHGQRHEYTEVHHRIVECHDGATGVEVMFGCVCDRYIDTVIAPTIAQARIEARRGVLGHAALAEDGR